MAVDPKGFESHGNSDHGMEFVVGVAHPAIGASNHLMTG